MIVLGVLVATLVAPPSITAMPVAPVDSFVVSGTVRDAQSKAVVAGATVLIDGTRIGAITSGEGRFRLVISFTRPTRDVTLRVRMIGYSPESRKVAVTVTEATVDFAMRRSETRLNEVVVTGAESDGRSSRPRKEREPVRVTVDKAAPTAQSAPLGATVTVTSASGAPQGVAAPPAVQYPGMPDPRVRDRGNREQYAAIAENPFLDASRNELSTFAIDVDRASYSNVRRFLSYGQRPPRDAVRIEELVNYFRYDYAAPKRNSADPLNVSIETHAAPWKPTHRLVRIGMQAKRIDVADLPPANLVFLIDVSGSMQVPNKMPLVIRSLQLLVNELREQDRVAIAVYAGAAGLVLPSTPGNDKATILSALDRLQGGGSTNGAAGIRLAYRVARESFITEGANRVILATDGDFNVGTTSDSELLQLIETERKSGVFLTVLGYGQGNIQDAKMELLADKGNGQYAYIDDLAEAQKALVREMGGTLFTLAKDVKIQVEFNPARVRAYRLLGYENRLLRAEDFNDDTKDAGELGAGHSVTALYEVELTNWQSSVGTGTVDPLRYVSNEPRRATKRGASEELAFVKVRYQPPQGGTSVLRSWAVTETAGVPTTDFTFASAVAGFGLLLRDSEHKGDLTWNEVRELAERGIGADRDGDRAGFIRLIGQAERLAVASRDVPR
jgi:Ca-activated chloride channel homolog